MRLFFILLALTIALASCANEPTYMEQEAGICKLHGGMPVSYRNEMMPYKPIAEECWT